MLYDKRYEDNIVLKKEAFQNLLTHIKNYPIVDIDYVEEKDVDVLHKDKIWPDYTDYTPCLKITYGDERTLKGNIIFAKDVKDEIDQRQKELTQLQIELNEVIYTYEKYKRAFEENKKAQKEKEEQITQLEQKMDTLLKSKNAYLVAGLSLLNFPFSRYYNAKFDGKLLNPNYKLDDLIDYNEQISLRYEKIDKNTILRKDINYYLKDINGNIDKQHPLDDAEANIALSNNQDVFVLLIDEENVTKTSTILDIRNIPLKYQDIKLETNIPDGKSFKYITFRYTTLDASKKLNILLELERIKNSAFEDNSGNTNYVFTEEQRNFITEFQDFIRSYNYLSFLDSLQAEYINTFQGQTLTEDQVEQIRLTRESELFNFNSSGLNEIANILNEIVDEDTWIWRNQTHPNYQAMWASFHDNMAQIAITITDVIANNLIRLKAKLVEGTDSFQSQIIRLQDKIAWTKQRIANLEEQILNQAGDRILYGYKYVKLGTNVKWDKTEPGNREDFLVGNFDSATLKSARNPQTNLITTQENYHQASGTFRVSLNEMVYEVPIKGFGGGEGHISNQDIYIRTQATKRGNVTTGGNINMLGNILASGNIITNNGNIYASGGSIGAAMYLAVRGYPVDTNGVSTNIYNPSDTAGLWYDGSAGNRILHTWNISDDENNVKLGTYQLALINGENSVGLRNENNVLEARNIPSDDEYVDFKARNIYTTEGLSVNGETILKGKLTAQDSIICEKNLTINGDSLLKGETNFDGKVYAHDNVNILGILTVKNSILPGESSAYDIGANNNRWLNVYAVNGDFTNLKLKGKEISNFLPSEKGLTSQFWRGGGSEFPSWSNELTDTFILSKDSGPNGSVAPTYDNSVFKCKGAAYFGRNIKANRVFNAVYNDYAECRKTIDLEAGRVVIDCDDGSLKCADQRLLPGAQIISDTFGHLMGETNDCKTPLAVAGRVLVYTYQDRNKYHAGMAVCSAPNGTIDIMTREEIKEYPDCIIGIVSEIPSYEYWGTDDIKVNNRIWIKVK